MTKRLASSSLLVLFLVLGACANKRVEALRVTFASVSAAREGFVKWDAHHQAEIAQKAPSKDEAFAELATYRADVQAKVAEGFTLAFHAIANALLLNDSASLSNAVAAGAAIVADVKALAGR